MKKRIFGLMLVLALALTACGNNAVEENVAVANEVVNDEVEGEEVATDLEETAIEEETEAVVEEEAELVELKVIAPYGTPVLSMAKMFVDEPEILDYVSVEYEAIQATDVLTSELLSGSADIAIVPTNLAAVLNVKEAGYKIAGVAVWGGLYVASTEEIASVEDLKGKEISIFGKGVTPDAMFRYVLTENGINPDEDLTLNYFSGISEVAADYLAGNSTTAMLAQPVLTKVMMNSEDTKVAISLPEEWSNITGYDNFPQASIIVSEELLNESPEVVEAFLTEFNASVDWLNENPAEAGAYYEGLDLGLTAPIVEKAIPEANLDYVPTSEAKEVIDAYLNVLFDFNPALTGGQAVDESVYYLQ